MVFGGPDYPGSPHIFQKLIKRVKSTDAHVMKLEWPWYFGDPFGPDGPAGPGSSGVPGGPGGPGSYYCPVDIDGPSSCCCSAHCAEQ